MPAGLHHNPRDFDDVLIRHALLEKVAHRIDEDHLRRLPTEGLVELLGNQPQVKALLVGVPWDPAESLSEGLRITVLAARADFFAASHRIPSGVSPFDA